MSVFELGHVNGPQRCMGQRMHRERETNLGHDTGGSENVPLFHSKRRPATVPIFQEGQEIATQTSNVVSC